MNTPAQPRFSGVPSSDNPRVLLMVDWINPLDHEDAERLQRPALEAARRAAALKARLRDAGVQTVYANDNYGVWRSDFRTLLKQCRQRGGTSAAITELLAPDGDDIAVVKPRHSAFYETPLQLLLQQQNVREIILSGVATEWCVLFTAMDAYVRGYSLRVPQDCIASASTERHRAAIAYMSDVLGANVAPSNDDDSTCSASGSTVRAAVGP
jgi:nicotinamidase-related amidase